MTADRVARRRTRGSERWTSPVSIRRSSRRSSARRASCSARSSRSTPATRPATRPGSPSSWPPGSAERGLSGEIVGEPADRRSFVLRLEGRRPGPSLLLLAHEDVVPANAADWQVPPFSGLIKDGYVWGRGAVDIKNLVAAHAVAAARIAAAGGPARRHARLRLHRRRGGGLRRRRPLARRHRPDLMRTDYVINEGGGHFLERAGRRVYLLESGEKGTAQFRLIVQGRGRPRLGAAAPAATPSSPRRASSTRSSRTSCRWSSTGRRRSSCACSSTRPRCASGCATRRRRARRSPSSRAATSSSPT